MKAGAAFRTTHWSVVLAAGDPESPHGRAALSTLCETYWYPLYAFARRTGAGPDEAQDLTQAFFARLLEKGSLRHADPGKGRFRSFLLASFKNFITDERIRASRHKRGGGRAPVPIDRQSAEDRYAREPAETTTPENIFERRWALTLVGRALARLREDYAGPERSRRFELLRGYLTGDDASVPYARVARELGVTEVTIKVAVHRMRRRFRRLLLEEVAHTVGSREEVDAEMRHLFEALGG